MIIGIGVDIVKTERFENYAAANRKEIRQSEGPVSRSETSDKSESRFMQRVFTHREREYLSGKNEQSVAGIFAAKEAVAKALGTGFNGFAPSDIEILHDENGKPFVTLHGGAEKIANGVRTHVSISHTHTDALAYAIAEREK